MRMRMCRLCVGAGPLLAAAGLVSLGIMEATMSTAGAGDVSVSSSSSASATAKSSSSASTSGECTSHATAEVTTTVNGETRTVRKEDSDQGKDCGAHAEARTSIESKEESTNQ